MTVGTVFNVATHIAAYPLLALAVKRNEPILVLFLLTSALVLSPTYHLCEDGIWCIFKLWVHTRLDLFSAQLVVTGVLQKMVPYRHYWQELAILAAVFFVQAAVLLRTNANWQSLQYIVIIISAAPLVLYIMYMYMRYWCGYENLRRHILSESAQERATAKIDADTKHTLSPRLRDQAPKRMPRRKGPRVPEHREPFLIVTEKENSTDQLYYPYFFYKLFNPRDFLLGACFGLVGLSLFRLHDINHTHYDLLHPWWHVFVFIGSYFLYRSAPPRGGVGYMEPNRALLHRWEKDLELSDKIFVT